MRVNEPSFHAQKSISFTRRGSYLCCERIIYTTLLCSCAPGVNIHCSTSSSCSYVQRPVMVLIAVKIQQPFIARNGQVYERWKTMS